MPFYWFLEFLNSLSWFPVFFVTPLYYTIGNACEEIYFAHLLAKREKKKILILKPFKWAQFLSYKLCNDSAFNIESKYCVNPNSLWVFLLRIPFTISFVLTRILAKTLRSKLQLSLKEDWFFPRIGILPLWRPRNSKGPFSFENCSLIDWDAEISSPIDIVQAKSEIDFCELSAKKMGIHSNKFICLHVRDGGYKGDHGRRSYRNADIDTYTQAIKHLNSLGLFVVRLGDDKMKKCSFQGPKFIDYPFSPFKSAAMDMYLIKNCYFFWGMQSGVSDTALLFQKPILMVNMYNWTFNYVLKSIDRGIVKHFFDKKKNRYLSLNEVFTASWKLQNTESHLDENFTVKDNDENEIYQAIIEYLALLEEKKFETSHQQIACNDTRKRHSRVLFKSDDCPPGQNIKDLPEWELYRYASRVDSSRGQICQFFLEKNWQKNGLNPSSQTIHCEN